VLVSAQRRFTEEDLDSNDGVRMRSILLILVFALSLSLQGNADAEEFVFRSGVWRGHVNLESTGCIMLSPFADNRGSVVVEMLEETDISVGIYWHKDKFDAFMSQPVAGKLVVDNKPSLDLTGEFVRNDYLRLSASQKGLLKHIFTAGAQGRLEYGADGWATFSLEGTSRAVDKLHDCWLKQKAKSAELASVAAAKMDAPMQEMNVFQSSNEAEKTATLTATACSEEEMHECVSHALNCNPKDELSIYIAGGEDPSQFMRLVSTITQSGYDKIHAEAVFDGGKIKVGLPIWGASFGFNDMNGTWDLTLTIAETDNFFGAINDRQFGITYIQLPETKLALSSKTTQNVSLQKFKENCLRLKAM
jgi:hypothetical protein